MRSLSFGFQGTGKALAGEGEGVYTEYMTEPKSREQHSQNLKGEGYICVLELASNITPRMALVFLWVLVLAIKSQRNFGSYTLWISRNLKDAGCKIAKISMIGCHVEAVAIVRG